MTPVLAALLTALAVRVGGYLGRRKPEHSPGADQDASPNVLGGLWAIFSPGLADVDVAQLEHVFHENPDQKETPQWDAISNQTEHEQILQFDLDLRSG